MAVPDSSKLVLEDAAGAVIATADLPGQADLYTIRRRSPGGVEVVSGIAREKRRLVQSRLDELLLAAGLPRVRLREALRTERLTCHQAFYEQGSWEFAGVGGMECRDALVFRTAADDGRPLEQQIGLIGNHERSAAGRTPRQKDPSPPSARPDPGPGALAGPVSVTWEDLIPTLEALMLIEQDPADPNGAVGLRVCTGKNNLDRLPPEKRDPVREQAVVKALIRLMKQGDAIALVHGYLKDQDFPRRVFQDAEVRARLGPLLAEEFGRVGIAAAF